MNPTPSISQRRLVADFRADRLALAGAASGTVTEALICTRAGTATALNSKGIAQTFVGNAARLTDRGLIVEGASKQLLTNSSLSGATSGPAGALPSGWRLNGAISSNVIVGDYNGMPAIWFDVTVTNASSEPLTYRIELEGASGIPVPTERQATFHGYAQVVSATNAAAHESRLLARATNGTAPSDQGRFALSVGAPARFRSLPPISEDTASLEPLITWVVAANSTSTTRLMLGALMLEPGLLISSFIPSFPPVENRFDAYPNPTLSGAAEGVPGTLPQFWSPGTVSSYGVVAVNADGSRDIELTGTAGVTDANFALPLNEVLPSGSGGVIPAAAGQVWAGSIEAQILSDSGTNARLNFSARNSSGATISGFNTSVSFTASVGLGKFERQLPALPTGVASLLLQVLISAPAGTTKTVLLRLRRPRCERIVITPGTASPERPLDLVRLADPAPFSGVSTVSVEAELEGLEDGATLLAIAFSGGHKLRLVAGPQVGIVLTSPGNVERSAFSPLYAAPGVIRLAVSYKLGELAIGFSDVCEGESATLSAPGFNPAVAEAVWLGSDNGTSGATTAIRIVEVSAIYRPAAELALRTRDRWFPRTFVQPIAGTRAPDIESVPAFSPPGVQVVGPTYNYVPAGNRYVRRSNGSAEMLDFFPPVSQVSVAEGAPFRINIVNDGTAPLRIRVRPDSTALIYAPSFTLPYTLPPISEIVVQPGRRILACLDGYNPATQEWEPNYNWWFVERAIAELSETYDFTSIYGPPSPTNPNRSIIFPPAFCSYNADIGLPRLVAAGAVQAMNRGIFNDAPIEFTKSIRYQRDAARSNYWRVSIGSTTITQLKTQICSMGFAYLGARDAGVGSEEDHRVIKEWFRDRMDQTIAFFNEAYDSGANVGRGNHATAAGLAAAVCAQILDRADYLRWAKLVYERAIEEAALEAIAPSSGPTGAFLLEMRRADKALQYQFLNMTFLLPLAEMLERAGFPAYSIHDGMLVKCVNWSMAALENPQLVIDEQNRLIALGPPWSTGVVAVAQQSLGLSADVDPITGEPLPNEGRVAAFYLAFRRLTSIQAPWRESFRNAFIVYSNIYNGGIGGSQSYLYRFLGITLPEPPPEV